MKVLMVGETGQLARFMQITQLQSNNGSSSSTQNKDSKVELVCLGREQMDLSQPERISDILAGYSFDVLVNVAAYTAVDKAESEPDLAQTINADSPAELAKVCAERNVPIIHYSTDYVFSGDATKPYKEEDATGPNSVYGETKLAGERAIRSAAEKYFIFRTAWVYGEFGQNFFLTMRSLAKERDSLSIVSDQVGGPTYARSIAECSWQVIDQLNQNAEQPWGTYHMSCAGEISWFEFARALLSQSGFSNIQLSPLTTAQYPTPAKRPAYSVLDNGALAKALGVEMPDWQQALASCIQHADGVSIDAE